MKYAVIRTGGKQYRVSEGDVIEVERLTVPEGEKVTFTDVLLVTDEDKTQIGTPTVANFPVIAEVVTHNKGPKIRVSKYKAKVRYRRVTGHRQSLSTVKIAVIGNATVKTVEKKPTEKVEASAVITSPVSIDEKKQTPKKAEVKTKTPAKKAAPKKKE